MARPIKKGVDYFPHDVHASSDELLEELQSVYKNDGYAAYFKLVERIYEKGGKLFILNQEKMQFYANKCNIFDVILFEKMINFMVEIKLFKNMPWQRKKCLTSDRIIRTMEDIRIKRDKDKNRYKKKVSDLVSEAEMGVETRQSKVNKSKLNKTKLNTPPGNHGEISMEKEVENFKNILKWDDQKIKENFLERGFNEVDIDRVMGRKF